MIGLAGSGYEADDRQHAVSLLLVLCEAGRGGGDLLPRLITPRPVQLFGRNGDRAAVHLDLDLIGMRGDVVVPRWIPRRAGR